MGISVAAWSERLLMGREDADPPLIGEGGLTFESLYVPAKRAGEKFELLDYVDPYAKKQIDERTYDRLVGLAEHVDKHVHTYLVFDGD
jgi:hypothetical protein